MLAVHAADRAAFHVPREGGESFLLRRVKLIVITQSINSDVAPSAPPELPHLASLSAWPAWE
jgi:hypothetical protein